MNSDYEAM